MAVLNSFRVLVALLIAVAVYFSSNEPTVQQRQAMSRRAPISATASPSPIMSCTKQSTFAMSFDNGISTVNTPPVLDALKAAGVKATFHVSTEWVNVNALVDALLGRMITEGHTVGFSWFGADPLTLSEADLSAGLLAQATKVFNAIGKYPRFVRFPYGTANATVVSIARANDFQVTSFTLDVADYHYCNATSGVTVDSESTAVANLLAGYKAAGTPLSVLSTHMDLCPVAAALAKSITTVQGYNYTMVNMETCLGEAGYKSVAGSATAGATTSTSATSTATATGTTVISMDFNAGATKTTTSTAAATTPANKSALQGAGAATVSPASGVAFGALVLALVAALA
ncbi:hypothetical protein AMAG_07749 [Allomyces macrogynus ATCC 38327]|uniref:NodB homology domain-containing protein n=1 Tax=Allomyces macrogynus (strain ATCC 38327) TaxID=578462 RepID=A0A0L0SJ61_ALLM3|nr:hypothetical protein AMAG_07749 [Allomyces macrogynus ATCC 38327]|eukprot:KNE62538.1 hypothetical protein AMAG_07749 [Allomyces macrogynus ATCC 38327]